MRAPAPAPAPAPARRRERGCNLDILGVEMAGTAALLPLRWNRRTGDWLRHYCYERISPPGSRGVLPFVGLLVTQTVSGLWHGLYAGYFLFFVSSSLMLQAAKTVYRYQARQMASREMCFSSRLSAPRWPLDELP